MSLFWPSLHKLSACVFRAQIQRAPSNYWYWAEYSTFSITDEADAYRLTVDGYSGDYNNNNNNNNYYYYYYYSGTAEMPVMRFGIQDGRPTACSLALWASRTTTTCALGQAVPCHIEVAGGMHVARTRLSTRMAPRGGTPPPAGSRSTSQPVACSSESSKLKTFLFPKSYPP